MNTFLTILPISSLIMLGFCLRRFFIAEDSFWRHCERLIYYIFVPSLLILKLSSIDFKALEMSYGFVSVILATLVLSVVLILFQAYKKMDNALFTSVFQGSIRFNIYVFLPITAALYGDEGIVLALILVSFMILILNVLSILVLSAYSRHKFSLYATIVATFKNPLILSLIVGVGISYFEIGLHPVVIEHLKYLSVVVFPFSLLCVGAGLRFVIHQREWWAIAFSSILKLMVLPLICVAFLKLFGVTGVIASVALIYCMLPTAPSSYILARQMGGDAEAMASILTVGTLLSMITIPLFIEHFF